MLLIPGNRIHKYSKGWRENRRTRRQKIKTDQAGLSIESRRTTQQRTDQETLNRQRLENPKANPERRPSKFILLRHHYPHPIGRRDVSRKAQAADLKSHLLKSQRSQLHFPPHKPPGNDFNPKTKGQKANSCNLSLLVAQGGVEPPTSGL